jgi:hypothetical protein
MPVFTALRRRERVDDVLVSGTHIVGGPGGATLRSPVKRDIEDIAKMDTAILSAASALAGSLIGGISTLAASWLTQRGQLRAQALFHESAKRESLYAEFISEASKRRADAWSHHAESPDVIAGLYSAVERMRLSSSDEVIRLAGQVVLHVADAYAAPDRTFDELRQSVATEAGRDPLRNFSEACRHELRSLAG